MSYYIRNDSLFAVGDHEGKDELVAHILDKADIVTSLDDVPGALDKTLYQSEAGFYFCEQGPYDFAVVGVEKKENGQSYIVLSNDKNYLERMLERN